MINIFFIFFVIMWTFFYLLFLNIKVLHRNHPIITILWYYKAFL